MQCKALSEIYDAAEEIKDTTHYDSKAKRKDAWKKGIGLVQRQIKKYFDKNE